MQPNKNEIKQSLEIACRAAQKAGAIHKKYFRSVLNVETKSTSFNLVSQADLESEDIIVKTIKKYFPDHNFLTEEKKYAPTTSPYTWIIDPLDGTNNFIYGIPMFCVSIALAYKDTLLVGVLYDVIHNELFTATKGGGAYLNDKAIHVRQDTSLKEAMLITGFYYDRGENMKKNLKIINNFFQIPILGLRRLGAAAVDLCYVACGRASGFWEFGLNPWDFAAGIILVQEAGGRLTTPADKNVRFDINSDIVASNGNIHNDMLAILQT